MSDNAWMMISNVIQLVCFTGLAIVFDRWWIVFFVVIFLFFTDERRCG